LYGIKTNSGARRYVSGAKKSLCSKKEESRYSCNKCKIPCVKSFYIKKRNPVFIREKREKLFGSPKCQVAVQKEKTP